MPLYADLGLDNKVTTPISMNWKYEQVMTVVPLFKYTNIPVSLKPSILS